MTRHHTARRAAVATATVAVFLLAASAQAQEAKAPATAVPSPAVAPQQAQANYPPSVAQVGYRGYGFWPPPPPAELPEHNSPGMMYTGAALTITGIVGLAVGNVVFFKLMSEPGDFAGLGAVVIGGPILLTSTVLMSVGIPLWAVGAADPDPDDYRQDVRLMPEVRIGAGHASASWSF